MTDDAPPLLAAIPSMLRGHMTHDRTNDRITYCWRVKTWVLTGAPCPYCEKETPGA